MCFHMKPLLGSKSITFHENQFSASINLTGLVSTSMLSQLGPSVRAHKPQLTPFAYHHFSFPFEIAVAGTVHGRLEGQRQLARASKKHIVCLQGGLALQRAVKVVGKVDTGEGLQLLPRHVAAEQRVADLIFHLRRIGKRHFPAQVPMHTHSLRFRYLPPGILSPLGVFAASPGPLCKLLQLSRSKHHLRRLLECSEPCQHVIVTHVASTHSLQLLMSCYALILNPVKPLFSWQERFNLLFLPRASRPCFRGAVLCRLLSPRNNKRIKMSLRIYICLSVFMIPGSYTRSS